MNDLQADFACVYWIPDGQVEGFSIIIPARPWRAKDNSKADTQEPDKHNFTITFLCMLKLTKGQTRDGIWEPLAKNKLIKWG